STEYVNRHIKAAIFLNVTAFNMSRSWSDVVYKNSRKKQQKNDINYLTIRFFGSLRSQLSLIFSQRTDSGLLAHCNVRASQMVDRFIPPPTGLSPSMSG